MKQEEKDNWKKIKDSLEAEGKTDNFFYKRAVAICEGKPDPFSHK